MQMLVANRESKLNKLRMDISQLESNVQRYKNKPDFCKLEVEINDKLDRMENEIVNTNKETFERDRMNFKMYTGYVWKKNEENVTEGENRRQIKKKLI